MKMTSFLIPFLVAETLIQLATEGYFTLTSDQSPFWGYVSFSVTVILILTAAWFATSRDKTVRSGTIAGFGLWVYAALLSVVLALIKYYVTVAPTGSPLALETKGYLVGLVVLTPIAFGVCWVIARVAATRIE